MCTCSREPSSFCEAPKGFFVMKSALFVNANVAEIYFNIKGALFVPFAYSHSHKLVMDMVSYQF